MKNINGKNEQEEEEKKIEIEKKHHQQHPKARFLVVVYSFSSGILACIVSVLIKLAFNNNSTSKSTSSDWLLVSLQTVAFIALAFVANSLMWLLFSRSLALTDKTVYATGLNKLANFVVSALAGLTLFNERFDLVQWSFGILLISVGLFLIASSSSSSSIPSENEKRKVS